MLDIFLSFFLTQSFFAVLSQVIALGGWIVLAYGLLFAGLALTGAYKAGKETSKWEWVLLAIDVPQMNVQTPKAVEQLFAHIFSIWEPSSIGTVFRRGYARQSYSFEIISIGGYIQFLIRVRTIYRDVVEAAVYAQYPQAEITEVEDYVGTIPDTYPNDTHNIWAAEYLLTKPSAYPIRMYKEFEHNISKDTVLKDPMGTLLESFTRIGPGEQVWFQMIIEPIAEKHWKEDAIKEIKNLIGEKTPSKKNFFDYIFDNPLTKELAHGTNEMLSQLTGSEGGVGSGESSDTGKDSPNNLLYLTPGQKKLVEAMEEKISKVGFNTKIRLVYSATHDIYTPSRAVNSFTGAMNQYNVPFSNTILPKYMTSVQYLFADQRKDYRRRVILSGYKKRDIDIGKKPFVFNTEELATVWHFPMSHVATPLLQKAQLKTAEPPIGLPVEYTRPQSEIDEDIASGVRDAAQRPRYKTDSGEVEYTNDSGGVRFG
ncbi:MAG: hypothetical protein COV60_02065 [Candidatus Magasanikbacteria bacterium CG11_big_fil_rev_8_21_14_0_20_43_7]|uniref:DUF8128 domain-containing protein n=1 Tax=Candidatus Magasanikbacteria bacterium CG11_big_fil_rev_8_21_14_0_20_43_7 TaxID=1974654 RepID=A0A2H0N2K9_9BACT|nr:MAG: hypothetical protein COV60_02065 [Candidatus Magasanikbacteria bacterium CG11_big_fil_rev_8_21_14_0_20_43_7]